MDVQLSGPNRSSAFAALIFLKGKPSASPNASAVKPACAATLNAKPTLTTIVRN